MILVERAQHLAVRRVDLYFRVVDLAECLYLDVVAPDCVARLTVAVLVNVFGKVPEEVVENGILIFDLSRRLMKS